MIFVLNFYKIIKQLWHRMKFSRYKFLNFGSKICTVMSPEMTTYINMLKSLLFLCTDFLTYRLLQNFGQGFKENFLAPKTQKLYPLYL